MCFRLLCFETMNVELIGGCHYVAAVEERYLVGRALVRAPLCGRGRVVENGEVEVVIPSMEGFEPPCVDDL